MVATMEIVFSSKSHRIAVSQQVDGSRSWSGQYNGASIKWAIPADRGKRCILLLDPDGSSLSVFENLLCIDQNEATIWTARLPSSPDVFLRAQQSDGGIWANTWSGFKVL